MLKQDLLAKVERLDRAGVCPPYWVVCELPCMGDCPRHYELIKEAIDNGELEQTPST